MHAFECDFVIEKDFNGSKKIVKFNEGKLKKLEIMYQEK